MTAVLQDGNGAPVADGTYRSTEAVWTPRFDVEICRLIEWGNSTLGSLLVPVHLAQRSDSPHRRAFAVLEPAWQGNQKNVSCVPCGAYRLVPIVCPTHGETWRLFGGSVGEGANAQRTKVEFHSGNLRSHTKGCPLPGIEFGRLDGEIAVLGSLAAMRALRQILPRDRELTLGIRNAGAEKWGPAFSEAVLPLGRG